MRYCCEHLLNIAFFLDMVLSSSEVIHGFLVGLTRTFLNAACLSTSAVILASRSFADSLTDASVGFSISRAFSVKSLIKSASLNFLKSRLYSICLAARNGAVWTEMYIKLCHVIPLCIGLKIIPLVLVFKLLDDSSTTSLGQVLVKLVLPI